MDLHDRTRPTYRPHASVPKSVKHLVLAAALGDLWRWLASKVMMSPPNDREKDV